ncbi:DNA-binding transcriptional regulator, ArsR family [Rathayibacter oskolensis]|uniref:DNA-binding transcriptional regulator, ArsR family n=1 Tax=Rathayibacter oskolensis TaxID=1891671 RepID=A0A1X7N5H8_9MICO|nr:metalloregulator ArsR/SmtB family transcription factor [Rathayibacter oskolensis]SMH31741.1 DNA-binding transcriptional regulator, ArsR family [Rathayibacter oskolensis]
MSAADLTEALRALAHPDRREFVRACAGAERSAGDLAELSSLSLASVSEHLKVLRKAGLLVLDRRGRHWMYRADSALLTAIAEAVASLGDDDVRGASTMTMTTPSTPL